MVQDKRIAWREGIAMLDTTEPVVREIIERGLVGVAGVPGTRYGDAMAAADAVIAQIRALRARAIKKAFKHIRERHGV